MTEEGTSTSAMAFIENFEESSVAFSRLFALCILLLILMNFKFTSLSYIFKPTHFTNIYFCPDFAQDKKTPMFTKLSNLSIIQ
jgi:hypothetical protein